MGSPLLSPSPDLAALIAAVARRDEAAFAALYAATAAKLLGVVGRIVRDRSVAEDVVQDAYLKVWSSAGLFSPEAGRPMTWLISIARHRAIDVVRRRTEVAMANDDGTDWLASIPEGRDREAEYADKHGLRTCLDRLDETQRRCFLEAYYEGLSREELAARYERPVNTIKTWLHRSAGNLRACLEGA